MAARKAPPINLPALPIHDGGRHRSDGRPHDTGLIRPYREKPADFRAVYLRMGWDGIDEHYNTNWRVIRRWIEQEGREQLIADRAAFVEAQRAAARKRRKRYVAGRTLTAVKTNRPRG